MAKAEIKRGQCRIISGKWRGRNIKFDDAEGLRPTTDRIRETVFSWLQPYLPQSHCLDCFAGSGVLGFEALSRGAADVVFLEKNKQTVRNLKQNAELLSAENALIQQVDSLGWLKSKQQTGQAFDIVFLDPPFHSGLLARCCSLLSNSGCLSEDAIIYVEHATDEKVELPENWNCLREKSSGQVSYQLFGLRLPEK